MPRRGARADGNDKGQRDAALVALGYGCGLRRDELARSPWATSTWWAAGHRAREGQQGARGADPTGAFHALRDYLEVRMRRPAGGDAGARRGGLSLSPLYKVTPLFVRARRGGDWTEGRVADRRTLYYVLTTAKEAGVEAFSPHDLRRSYVGDLLDEADLSVAQLVRWARESGHYCGVRPAREQAKEQAASRLDVPYDL